MKKPKKQPTLGQLHEKLWKLFSEFTRLIEADENGYCACITCGCMRYWKRIQAGHFISRGHKYLLYDRRNVHPQCGGCNCFKQGDYARYRKAMVLRYGECEVFQMEERKDWPADFTRWGLKIHIEEYAALVKHLKTNVPEEF